MVGRRKPCRKSFALRSLTEGYLSVISIGCENVKIIRITRAKVEFGLRFKKWFG